MFFRLQKYWLIRVKDIDRQTHLMKGNEMSVFICRYLWILYISLFPCLLPWGLPITFIITEGNNLVWTTVWNTFFCIPVEINQIFKNSNTQNGERDRETCAVSWIPPTVIRPNVVLEWLQNGVDILPGFDCRSAQQRYIQLSTVNRRKTIKCFFKNSLEMFRPCFLFLC